MYSLKDFVVEKKGKMIHLLKKGSKAIAERKEPRKFALKSKMKKEALAPIIASKNQK